LWGFPEHVDDPALLFPERSGSPVGTLAGFIEISIGDKFSGLEKLHVILFVVH